MNSSGKSLGGLRGITLSATLALFFCLGLGTVARAYTVPSVVINEVMWDGDEYVELLNTTGSAISLASWKLNHQKPGGAVTTFVTFGASDKIAANGYFLI